MTIVARLAISIALLSIVTSQARAFEWPHPFGHDVGGSIGDRIEPFGRLELLGDLSNVDDDGQDQSSGGLVGAELGAALTLSDRLIIKGALRTGDDHRTSYLNFGGGDFDQNFGVSISQIYADWHVPTPLGLADDVNIRIGRQPLTLHGNNLYSQTVIDKDLNLDGVQLDWDCGCEEWDLMMGGSIGGWKLNRSFDMPAPSSPAFNNFGNDYETETARLLTAGTYAVVGSKEHPYINGYVNYYHYSNSDDGFGGDPDSADEAAGIVDSPDIIQAGINTDWAIAGARIYLSGEYFNNLDADHDADGYTAGVGVGLFACEREHRISYLYQNVGAWSIVPGLAQDDHRDARAAYKGHVVQGEWNSTDHIRLFAESFIADTDSDAAVESDAWRVRFGARIEF